jgi:surface polysaccharide O-acyltransferase-like enzyme
MDNRQTPRQSNIELLRIAAMIFIIAHHFAGHGKFFFPVTEISLNRLWIQFLLIGGKVGVNVFVLISGYFMVSAREIKTGKVLRLWGQIFFYSLVIFGIFVLGGIRPFGIREMIRHLAPVTFTQWWFASTYFVLYLLSPFLNKMLNSFDKKQYVGFLALLTALWCIIPTFTGKNMESNFLLWFVYLYCLAGYFRLHGFRIKLSAPRLLGLSFGFALLTFLSAVVFDVLGTKMTFFGEHATYFYDMQRLPVLLISVSMLLGFLKLEIGYSKWINRIASATFGVYLLHDHPYVRTFLWETVFQNAAFADSKLLIPYSLLAPAVVFVICTAVELSRMHLLEQRLRPVFEKLAGVLDGWKERFLSDRVIEKL